jgi:anti-sigma28 factor (negative regulator of flagellin synthesis)
MTVLNQENTESSVNAENTDVTLNCGSDNRASVGITNPAFYLLPSVRNKKVLEIRQQLIEGKYDIDKGLNIALDRLIEGLIAEDRIDYLRPNPCQLE